MNGLLNEVLDLIDLKKEGEYWDFKSKHHSNNAELIHDILCLANTVTKSNKYLIFGVKDQTFELGCLEETLEESSFQNILDKVEFLGGNKPVCKFHTLEVPEGIIQVIEIIDSTNKPYMLAKDLIRGIKKVRSHVTYCRNGDTNSPINEGADLSSIEAIWKERFGLDVTAAYEIIELMKNRDEWVINFFDSDHEAHHMIRSDFTIKLTDPERFYPFYRLFYVNEKCFLGEAEFYKGQTKLFTVPYVFLDEYRTILPKPKIRTIECSGFDIYYFYYLKHNHSGALLRFITKEGNGWFEYDRFYHDLFQIFDSREDRNEFEEFVKQNDNDFLEIPSNPKAAMLIKEAERNNEHPMFDPDMMYKLKEMRRRFIMAKRSS